MDALRKWLEPLGSWGKWVIATGIGLYVGWSLNLVIRPLLAIGRIDLEWALNDLKTIYMNLDLAGFLLLAVLSGLVTGAIVGLFQWLALLRKTGDKGLWIPATAIGFGVDFLLKAVFFLVEYSERGQFPLQRGSIVPLLFVITPFLGAFLVGLSQWFVLRRRVRLSGLWMLTMPVAIIPTIVLIPEIYAISSSLKAWVMRLAPTTPIGVIPLTKVVYPLLYLFEGIIVGAVTGVVIVFLFRKSIKQMEMPFVDELKPVGL